MAEKKKSGKKTRKKVGSTISAGKNITKGSKKTKKSPTVQKVNLPEFLKTFDKLLNEGDLKTPQTMLDGLRGIKKWQRLNLQSVIEYNKKNLPLAENLMRQALREPDVKPGIHKNLAGMLIKQGRMREALPFVQISYNADKKDLKAAQLYLNCLLDLGQAEQVLKETEKILKEFPDDKVVLVSRASALRSAMNNVAAQEELDILAEKFPDEPVIYRIKADLLGDKSTKDALPEYEKALQLSIKHKGAPDPAIEWNMSLHLLRARDLKRGWSCWEQGFHPIVGTMGRNLPPRITSMDRADNGKQIDKNKWTIVCAEQGIGDQVLFMHSMNEAIEELGKVLYITEERLHPIIKRSFPNMEVAAMGVSYDWERNSLNKNGYIPLGSIPRMHRNSLASYHNHRVPFLRASKELYHKYRSALQKEAEGRPIIGISWKGGYWAIQRKSKALELENWNLIFDRNALYVNLQYGDIREELNYLRERNKKLVVFDKLDFRNDIDDWVAIAAACDGIISVSTALVHFAGAIGQKVAVVMPGEQGPWHLGLEDTESFAYKNVRIYRPSKDESLQQLIERVAKLIT